MALKWYIRWSLPLGLQLVSQELLPRRAYPARLHRESRSGEHVHLGRLRRPPLDVARRLQEYFSRQVVPRVSSDHDQSDSYLGQTFSFLGQKQRIGYLPALLIVTRSTSVLPI